MFVAAMVAGTMRDYMSKGCGGGFELAMEDVVDL